MRYTLMTDRQTDNGILVIEFHLTLWVWNFKKKVDFNSDLD